MKILFFHGWSSVPGGRKPTEGAAKNLIGRRLKQTGARCRVRRVNRMATLCSAFDSDHWDAYWNSIQN